MNNLEGKAFLLRQIPEKHRDGPNRPPKQKICHFSHFKLNMAAFMGLLPQRTKKEYKTRIATRDCDYKQLYRFEKVNVEWIARHFLGEKTETRGGALSSEQKMKIFLRYMADPGFQVGVGEDLGVDQTTVSKTIHEVSLAYINQ